MFWAPLLASVLIASEVPAPEGSVKLSLSRTDPNVATGTHTTGDFLEVFLFMDDMPGRGGEFGLLLEGGECLGFLPDENLPWVVLPGVRPYPGTIAQATGGPECAEPPVLFGRLLVKPATPGGRIVVDVIPSERSSDVALLRCDNSPVNEVMAHPVTINGNGTNDPVPHVLVRPPDPPATEPLMFEFDPLPGEAPPADDKPPVGEQPESATPPPPSGD